MHVSEIPQINGLSTPEKILLLEEMWDTIASDEQGVPILESHKNELDVRLKMYEADPERLLSFEEFRNRVAKRK